MDVGILKRAYPHIAPAIDSVGTLIRQIPKHKGGKFCELEARVGVISTDAHGKSYFKSGAGDMDTSFISRVLCKLETSDVWKSKTDWTEQVDRYYLLPSGLEVRTTTEGVIRKEGGESVQCVVSHMIKTDVAHADFKWEVADPRCLLASETGVVLDVRVSIKQEETVFEDELQDRVDDLHVVRIKQRKSFKYASKTEDVWSVDITQVYQAPTFVEALMLLRNGHVSTYEMEIECENAIDHLKHMDFDYGRLAASLLLKTADMFECANGPKIQASGSRLVPQ